MKEKEPLAAAEKRQNFVPSGVAFVLSYIVLLAIVFVMIVCNDPAGWIEFMRDNVSGILSLVISIFLLCFIIYYYYYFEDKDFLLHAKNIALIFSVFALSLALNYVFGKFVNIYARPFALSALMFLLLFNRRQAILLNFVYSLMMFVIDMYTNNFGVGATDPTIYFSLLIGFVSGTFCVFIAGGIKTRGGLLAVGAIIAVPTVVIILLLELSSGSLLDGSVADYFIVIGWGALGCLCSVVFAITFLPIFEALFSRLTVFRLRELTRTDAPLLMRLKTEAPGTFNHSIIVAQLAESCALALGVNAELARAAAYYHDVGKLKQPECFTENQGDYNIHDELTPELSADIIRSHTKDGYDLLNANHLPPVFADVAREHHGTMPIKYFYAKAMRLTGGDAKLKDYSYFGPTPQSKIAAIVMIADSAEAAVRALKDRSPESVEQVIRGIIEERMNLDQFVDCDITMRELTTIKQTLVSALSGVHHHRVNYPSIKFKRGGQVTSESDGEKRDDK